MAATCVSCVQAMDKSRSNNPKSRRKNDQQIDYLRLSMQHAKKNAQAQAAAKKTAPARAFAARDVSQKEFSVQENQLLHVLIDIHGLQSVVQRTGNRHLIPGRFNAVSYDEAVHQTKILVSTMRKLRDEISDEARISVVEKKATALANVEAEATATSGLF